jgi:hypothetical protein
MTFDNKKTTYRIYLRKLYIAILFTIIIVVFLASGWFDKPFQGLSKYMLILIVAIIYVLIIIINFIRDLNYFYFSDNGPNIIVRYYPLRPLSSSRRSVEIPKTSFAGYEIRQTMLGLKKILILMQVIKKSIAKYPPISITSLTAEELSMLTGQLSQYRKV